MLIQMLMSRTISKQSQTKSWYRLLKPVLLNCGSHRHPRSSAFHMKALSLRAITAGFILHIIPY